MNELRNLYNTEIKNNLMEKFNYSSVMQVPKLSKIVVNIGVGDASHDSKFIEAAKAKKSIAAFKLREGQPIGVKVTLRGDAMYNFMEKLIKVALPRVRDFRGISSKAFDGFGNYTLGIKEQLIFPEINYDEIVKLRGMDIVFVTTAETNEEALELLSGFGMPFRK